MDYMDEYDEAGLMMMVDFEKAYDSLEWDFMIKVLQHFNFGPDLIKWIKTFYTNIESCVSNNSVTSQYFKISRGLRQGDPLSSYIFVLCVEILAIAVRNNDDIQGIEINENVIKIAQYADDTTAILKDVRSARNFLQLLERFSKISGLKINKEKTEALWLGTNKFNIS